MQMMIARGSRRSVLVGVLWASIALTIMMGFVSFASSGAHQRYLPVEWSSWVEEAVGIFDDSSKPNTDTMGTSVVGPTLALLDPRLLGGFRNQQMRLTGLIIHAQQKNITNLLLESLRYDNKAVSDGNPPNASLGRIPFEALFDVDHWNSVSDRYGRHILPRLVRYSPTLHPDWDPHHDTFRAVNITAALLGGRRHDLWPLIENCTAPYAFGSGKGGGRLWNAYLQFKGHNRHLTRTEEALAEALRPAPPLAKAVQDIVNSVAEPETWNDRNNTKNSDLLVIHPRCEPEMLVHRCSKRMARNLTLIFGMIENSTYFSDTTRRQPKYGRAFLCISRSNMKLTETYASVKYLADQNLQALNHAAQFGLWNGSVPVREGGERLAASLQDVPSDMIETVAQIINFFVAVQAKAFVGTFGSSYSTDVWTTRHVLYKKKNKSTPSFGRGQFTDVDPLNFYHGPDGVGMVGNGGLPPPHWC